MTRLRACARPSKWPAPCAPTGHELAGIRLDSGDLAYLSREARAVLDEAGFPDTRIVASNDLEENLITSLKQQGARIDTWGVGTQLITAYNQAALGGVYKLAALRKADDSGWEYTIKLSEQVAKTSIPGILQIRRYLNEYGKPRADMLYNTAEGLPNHLMLVDPADSTRRLPIRPDTQFRELLEPVFRRGRRVLALPTLAESRALALREVQSPRPQRAPLPQPPHLPRGPRNGPLRVPHPPDSGEAPGALGVGGGRVNPALCRTPPAGIGGGRLFLVGNRAFYFVNGNGVMRQGQLLAVALVPVVHRVFLADEMLYYFRPYLFKKAALNGEDYFP